MTEIAFGLSFWLNNPNLIKFDVVDCDSVVIERRLITMSYQRAIAQIIYSANYEIRTTYKVACARPFNL